MEVVGTQNDFLKFKDDIVIHAIKLELKIHDLEKTITQETRTSQLYHEITHLETKP